MTPAERDTIYEARKAQANRALITLGRNYLSNSEPLNEGAPQ